MFLASPTTEPPIAAEPPSTRSEPYPQLTLEESSSDLMRLAEQIEDRLHLKNSKPKPFSQDLLTKEGLRRSRGPLEDFEERVQRAVYLIVEPGTSEVFEPGKADIVLHFEPFYDEMTAIFGDIIGVDLAQRDFGSLTDAEAETIEKEFPVFWKISEYHEDAYLSPQEAALLLRECNALGKVVSSPEAIRGLDKFWRIANWASEKHYGILFSAP